MGVADRSALVLRETPLKYHPQSYLFKYPCTKPVIKLPFGDYIMGGRAVVVGDPFQSLYRFRGADSKAFSRIAEMLKRNHRPLTICDLPVNYRCDQMIISHAQQWVPGLKGNSQALGTVGEIVFSDATNRANNDGFDIALPDGINGQQRTLPVDPTKPATFAFLCRINVPLVVTAYQLIAQGKRCAIIGRTQLGAPLKRLIEELCHSNSPRHKDYTNRISDLYNGAGAVVEHGLLSRLADYYRVQAVKLADQKYEQKLELLAQNVECIEVIAQKVKDDKITSIFEEIENLFKEDQEPGVISLSTIHRAKGLEWDVVFILRPDLLPHPAARPNPDGSWSDEQQQEQNCQYVAATRPRSRLYYVINWPFGRQAKRLAFDTPISNDEIDMLGRLGDMQGCAEDTEEGFMDHGHRLPLHEILKRVNLPQSMKVSEQDDLKAGSMAEYLDNRPSRGEDRSGPFVDDGEPF